MSATAVGSSISAFPCTLRSCRFKTSFGKTIRDNRYIELYAYWLFPFLSTCDRRYAHSFLVPWLQKRWLFVQGSRLSNPPGNHQEVAAFYITVQWIWPNICQHIESGHHIFQDRSIILDEPVLLWTPQWLRWFDRWSQWNRRLRSTGVVHVPSLHTHSWMFSRLPNLPGKPFNINFFSTLRPELDAILWHLIRIPSLWWFFLCIYFYIFRF